MTAITVRIGGEERSFAPEESPILVGSGPGCAVVSSNRFVAPRHAVIQVSGSRWAVVAEPGAYMYVSGQQVPKAAIGGSIEVRLGHPGEGEALRFSVVSAVPTDDDREASFPPPPADPVPQHAVAPPGSAPGSGVGDAGSSPGTSPGEPPRNNMGLAITAALISLVVGCWPIGIAAVVCAVRVRKVWDKGDLQGALSLAKRARILSWVTLASSVIVVVVLALYLSSGMTR